MSEVEATRANAATVYAKVLYWIHTKMSAKQLDECRASASASLKYLSLPVSQLRKDHERCELAVSRQRLGTFRLVPEDFVRRDVEKTGSQGLVLGLLIKSKSVKHQNKKSKK